MLGPVLTGEQDTGPALGGLSIQADMDLKTGSLSAEGRCSDGGGTGFWRLSLELRRALRRASEM